MPFNIPNTSTTPTTATTATTAQESIINPDCTYVVQTYPWGLYVDARVKCPDGVKRKVSRISSTADTYFSIPAAVQVRKNGKRYTVAGYVTPTEDWIDQPDPTHPDHPGRTVRSYEFRPYTYRKNGSVFSDV